MANSNINHVCLSGNIVQEPRYSQTASGTGILNFCVASNDSRRDSQTGEWKSYPNYVDCVLIGKRAGSLSSILQKGMKVCVDGKLRHSTWTTKDGQRRSKLEVSVNEIEFMQQRQQPMQQSGYQGDVQYVQAETYETPQQGGFFDSDCPF